MVRSLKLNLHLDEPCIGQRKTAKLLRNLADECDRGKFSEALILLGAEGRIAGGAIATAPGSPFRDAAKVVIESCNMTEHNAENVTQIN